MFFTSFDVTKRDLWNPAPDPLSPSPWTPCCQEAMLFLSRPFLLAFRCGGKANKREGAGQPHAQSALIITYAGPSAAFFCFPKASLFFWLAVSFGAVRSIFVPHWSRNVSDIVRQLPA